VTERSPGGTYSSTKPAAFCDGRDRIALRASRRVVALHPK
jgi:hypothetical protein